MPGIFQKPSPFGFQLLSKELPLVKLVSMPLTLSG